MAPTIRYTAIPASLWDSDSDFLGLSARSQWLCVRLWTSGARNPAGFVPLQLSLWAKSSTTTIERTIHAAVDELCSAGWLIVDFDAELAWLCRFIEGDTWNSPNQFVSVLNAIRDCPSWMLRDAAWKEVQRLGLPPVKSDNPETQRRMRDRMQKAYEALAQRMSANPKGDRKGLERVSELPNAHAHAHVDEDADAAQPNRGARLACASQDCSNLAGSQGYCHSCTEAATW